MAGDHSREDVQRQLQRYLEYDIGRGALQEWLLDLLAGEDGSEEALALAWKAERCLMEESRGEHSDDELRRELADLTHPSLV